ncbi:MAG: glycerol kinase GlpK [Deltaproteobacteria bacterium]|nr:glycerol kinase GlpK [Deltaproteobacteria bacterium]
MEQQYIMAIDQGTTGTTVLILDFSQKPHKQILARSSTEFPQHFPKAGWVEHNLDEIWFSLQHSSVQAITIAQNTDPRFHPDKIASIGITNQRESICIWDQKSGRPLRPAIIWQCRRGTVICQSLRQSHDDVMIRQKTGLFTDPYFSGSKILWLKKHEPETFKQVEKGHAVIGTIDTWLISRLTAGKAFVTDASNASRTLLFNIHNASWDPELCQLFGLKTQDKLAEVRDSAGFFGRTQGVGYLPDGIPINGVLGDQQAALAGQACFEAGQTKCTYGTGAFLLSYTGKQAIFSTKGLLTTVSWKLNGELFYALEGSAFIAGAAIQFMRDQLNFLQNASESEELAAKAKGAPEIYFVPALTGLGAPWWNPEARGAFLGLTRGTTKNQLIRAALEAIAFQVCDLMDAAGENSPYRPDSLNVDGGGCSNPLLMQIQANLANIVIKRHIHTETTALGAGMFAALGCGIVKNIHDLSLFAARSQSYQPESSPANSAIRLSMLDGWRRALTAVEAFSKQKNKSGEK